MIRPSVPPVDRGDELIGPSGEEHLVAAHRAGQHLRQRPSAPVDEGREGCGLRMLVHQHVQRRLERPRRRADPSAQAGRSQHAVGARLDVAAADQDVEHGIEQRASRGRHPQTSRDVLRPLPLVGNAQHVGAHRQSTVGQLFQLLEGGSVIERLRLMHEAGEILIERGPRDAAGSRLQPPPRRQRGGTEGRDLPQPAAHCRRQGSKALDGRQAGHSLLCHASAVLVRRHSSDLPPESPVEHGHPTVLPGRRIARIDVHEARRRRVRPLPAGSGEGDRRREEHESVDLDVPQRAAQRH